jgi:hypothetical protein
MCRNNSRDAEPKDIDINKERERNLHRSTYNRIGNVTDGVSQSWIHILRADLILAYTVKKYDLRQMKTHLILISFLFENSLAQALIQV